MNIIALIPARSGSKSITDKNIRLYNKKPLLVHSIEVAEKSEYINEIYVSTDSEKYREIAINAGAKAPFLRPPEISSDLSPDFDFIKHFLDWYFDNKKKYPDIIVQLRPTYPNRNKKIMDNAIKQFLNNYKDYDSLRSVIKIEKSSFKMYTINNMNLIPTVKKYGNIIEPYNQCRQLLPDTYLHNGYIDIIKSSTIINKNTITGDMIYPYIMSEKEIHDIDTEDQWKLSESNVITL